jgi:hypothetical protein
MQVLPAEDQPEAEALEPRRKPWRKAEGAVVIAQAAKARDRDEPHTRERSDVHSITRVVFEIVEVHERCFAEVVIRELEVPDLCSDDGLGASRERRISCGKTLIVRKVARLLLVIESITADAPPVNPQSGAASLHHPFEARGRWAISGLKLFAGRRRAADRRRLATRCFLSSRFVEKDVHLVD